MLIEINKLPTHVAQVGRRLNVLAPDDLAATFLETSYLAEVAIKTIALVLLAGVRDRIPDHAYRISHGLVRADGLGNWEMRVVLGEMAKEGRYTPPKQLIPKRMDIVDAVFERSFNKLSDAGRNVFLMIANWKSEISELALLVVLGQRGLDIEAGIEECKRLSMILPNELINHQPCYSSPQLARVFGHKKLQGDVDRLVIQEDIETLRRFGVIGKARLEQQTQDDLILQFVNWCMNEAVGKDSAAIGRLDAILESVANLWPHGWLHLAKFRQSYGADAKQISYALRRAVEEQPFNKKAWLERATFAEKTHDESTRIASLVSAVDADPGDVELIREVAFLLSQFVNQHLYEIPKARRGVYLASVRAHMEKVASDLDATGMSRLAWLFLLEDKVEKARKYANDGCSKDQTNKHCLSILERIENQVN
jgi:hypothetical protein